MGRDQTGALLWVPKMHQASVGGLREVVAALQLGRAVALVVLEDQAVRQRAGQVSALGEGSAVQLGLAYVQQVTGDRDASGLRRRPPTRRGW